MKLYYFPRVCSAEETRGCVRSTARAWVRSNYPVAVPLTEHDCVQLPTSADNVTLLAFAAERRPCVQQSIDITSPPGPQQQTRGGGVRWDGRTDRHTDAQPLHRPCRIIGNESVPIQLAQCRRSLVWPYAEILMNFSNKLYGSNFIKKRSKTVMVRN